MDDLAFILFLFSIAMVWSLIWKGVALWKSARYGQTAWFVVLLVDFITISVLEIIYLAFFQKRPIQRIMKPAPAPRKVARKRR
jgi:hypothetical protein